MTLEDLKMRGSFTGRAEPTGKYYINRNGTRVQETKYNEYVVVRGQTLSKAEWYEALLQAVREEGKEYLLEIIMEHCQGLAWLRTDKDRREYALEILSSGAYMSWPEFSDNRASGA